MQVITISNIKGGVGKSSTAATLAAGLAKKGYRALMIDSDPQINLSMCFLSEQSEDAPSLYHVYNESRPIDEVKITVKDGLDLVVGDFSLANADMMFLKAGRLKMLQKAFKRITTDYDFIIIDTPPNLGVLSLNGFFASDYLIVPMSVDSFSLKGVRLLKETLDDIMEEAEKKIPVAGILLTMYNARINVSKLLEKSVNSAAELLDTKVFNNRIRQAVAMKESQLAKMSLFDYASSSPIAGDYLGFIDELLERIGVEANG